MDGGLLALKPLQGLSISRNLIEAGSQERDQRQKKPPRESDGLEKVAKSRKASASAAAAELLVELVHATGGVNKALFTGVSRVGGHGDIA